MGCDIHLFAEVMRGGKWDLADDISYHGRNYVLFAALAGVRNSWDIKPICEPRGLPLDAHSDQKEKYDESGELIWWLGDHSYSFLSLAELLKYDWNHSFDTNGIVTPGLYIEFREKGRPSRSSGGVFGRGIRVITNSEMDRLIGANEIKIDPVDEWFSSSGCYTEVWWKETVAENAVNFFEQVVEPMKKLTAGGGADVRIVFGFDS